METFDFNNQQWKNLNRKEKYDLVKKFTGDTSLASKARDWGFKRLNEESGTRKIQFESDGVQLSNARYAKDRYKENRQILRDLGYTSKEADKIKTESNETLNRYIITNTTIDVKERQKNWVKMSKKVRANVEKFKNKNVKYTKEDLKKDFDPELIDLIEKVNSDNGDDLNAKTGWGTVYYYYTQGGSIEFWKSQLDRSAFTGNIYTKDTNIILKN